MEIKNMEHTILNGVHGTYQVIKLQNSGGYGSIYSAYVVSYDKDGLLKPSEVVAIKA
jgi:hypothetical protein